VRLNRVRPSRTFGQRLQAGVSPRTHLTQSVFKVILQTSTPQQIRPLILHCCSYRTSRRICAEITFEKRLQKHFVGNKLVLDIQRRPVPPAPRVVKLFGLEWHRRDSGCERQKDGKGRGGASSATVASPLSRARFREARISKAARTMASCAVPTTARVRFRQNVQRPYGKNAHTFLQSEPRSDQQAAAVLRSLMEH